MRITLATYDLNEWANAPKEYRLRKTSDGIVAVKRNFWTFVDILLNKDDYKFKNVIAAVNAKIRKNKPLDSKVLDLIKKSITNYNIPSGLNKIFCITRSTLQLNETKPIASSTTPIQTTVKEVAGAGTQVTAKVSKLGEPLAADRKAEIMATVRVNVTTYKELLKEVHSSGSGRSTTCALNLATGAISRGNDAILALGSGGRSTELHHLRHLTGDSEKKFGIMTKEPLKHLVQVDTIDALIALEAFVHIIEQSLDTKYYSFISDETGASLCSADRLDKIIDELTQARVDHIPEAQSKFPQLVFLKNPGLISQATRVIYNESYLEMRHSVQWLDQNKKFVYDLLTTVEHPGTIGHGRHPPSPFGTNSLEYVKAEIPIEKRKALYQKPVTTSCTFVAQETIYAYPQAKEKEMRFQVNFADKELFGYCKTGLFAQDEMMAAEHPCLAHLRTAIEGDKNLSQIDPGKRQVALVMNVSRLGKIDTSGIYGNNFVSATQETLRAKVKKLAQASKSNLLAMTALNVPPSLAGTPYQRKHVEQLFETAFAGFSLAKQEATLYGKTCTIDTGNWGCGAFGNNHELIALIQIAAADLAGVDALVHNGVSRKETEYANTARAKYLEIIAQMSEPKTVEKLIDAVCNRNYLYGIGNGT